MSRSLRALLIGLVVASACTRARPATDPLPTPPPTIPDRPIALANQDETDLFYALIEPCRVRALASYPQAKRRFVAGLAPGHYFSITTRLVDADSRREQVFVLVDSIRNSDVFGKLASDIGVVRGYRHGQALRVAESAIVDWTIVRPDGSEEGNLMGQVIDALQDGKPNPGSICAGEA